MRKTILVVASVALAMMVAGGVAWAANIQCPNGKTTSWGTHLCWGTPKADTMIGTSKEDNLIGKEGNDTIYGRSAHDGLFGNAGSDTLYGQRGSDHVTGQVGPDKLYGGLRSDYMFGGTDDYVHGGADGDSLYGNAALGGVAHLYGEDGDDRIHVSQRQTQLLNGKPVPPESKEIVDCGPGTDTVLFDEGVDVVNANCEIKQPYAENTF
jgi:serralysin